MNNEASEQEHSVARCHTFYEWFQRKFVIEFVDDTVFPPLTERVPAALEKWNMFRHDIFCAHSHDKLQLYRIALSVPTLAFETMSETEVKDGFVYYLNETASAIERMGNHAKETSSIRFLLQCQAVVSLIETNREQIINALVKVTPNVNRSANEGD